MLKKQCCKRILLRSALSFCFLGKIPDAGPRRYAVTGELPENVYESSHDD
jgi:hypothetical protein